MNSVGVLEYVLIGSGVGGFGNCENWCVALVDQNVYHSRPFVGFLCLFSSVFSVLQSQDDLEAEEGRHEIVQRPQ